MATRSNFRLGYIAVNYVNEGSDTDISAYLGTHKVYPLISLENAVVTCASTTYNGSNLAAQSITVTLNGVTLTKNVDYSIIENAGGIVAGNYTVTVKGIGNYCDTKSGTFTINKANQSAPTAYGASVAYGNTATATTSGGGSQGSIEWSNGNTLTGNAGSSKTTKARWSGNSNYNPSSYSNEVTLSIVKANLLAPTAYGATTTYSTTATASASGGGGQGSIEWSNGNTQTSIGSKSTQARWSGNSNYNASSWSNSVTLTMNKASQNAPTVTGATTTYPTTATATASGGGGLGSIEWESAQSQTSIGSHTTKARWTGNSNYNASPWSNTVTVKMDKATGSASVSGRTGLVFNPGVAYDLISVSGNTGTMHYRLGTDGSWKDFKPATNVPGTYIVYYYMDASTNYTARGSSSSPWGSVSTTIDKATPSLSWSSLPLNMVKGDSSTVSASASNGASVSYSSNSTEVASVSESTITAVSKGSCTITATCAETTNYKSASISYILNVKIPLKVKIDPGELSGVGSYATRIKVEWSWGLFESWSVLFDDEMYVEIGKSEFTTIGISKDMTGYSGDTRITITDSNGNLYEAESDKYWMLEDSEIIFTLKKKK